MHFKIKTLDLDNFRQVCADLEGLVDRSGFTPDLVIGIPRGGDRILAEAFKSHRRLSIKLIRPTRGRLKKMLGGILKHMPMKLRDFLRIYEAKKLVVNRSHIKHTTFVAPEIGPDVHRILIVDDAVDSGATLEAILSVISGKAPDAEIKSAAITVTNPEASVIPDYYIFNDRTLIRTPWSIDMKN